MSSTYEPATSDTVDVNYRASSSCNKSNHYHNWPVTGELEIERCEHYCLYCRGPKATKKWSSAWFLRRHVRETHAKTEFPGLTVSEGWSKRPTGNTRPISKKQRAPGSNKKRVGTKKDRAATMLALEEIGRHNSLAPTITDQHLSRFIPAQPAYMQPAVADPGYALSSVEHCIPDFNNGTWDPLYYLDPQNIELFSTAEYDHSIDSQNVELFSTARYTPCTDMFDFDSYSAAPSIVDSGIGSSITSTAHTMDSQQSASNAPTTPVADEFEFGNRLLAAFNEPVDSMSHATMDSFSCNGNDAMFEDMFAGAQFTDRSSAIHNCSFNDLAIDPFFADFDTTA